MASASTPELRNDVERSACSWKMYMGWIIGTESETKSSKRKAEKSRKVVTTLNIVVGGE